MPRARLATLICVTVLMAGCARFPELDRTIEPQARQADYPALLPVDELAAISAAPAPAPGTAAAPDPPDARIARLKARAARLRGGVIDEETRARMDAGVE